MKGDDVLAGQVRQPVAELLVQLRQALGVGGTVGLNGRGVVREGFAQSGAEVVHHGGRVGGVQPQMGVDFMFVGFGLCLVMVVELAVLLQQGNARGGVHHRQLRESVHHVLQVALHARPVDEEYIRLRQGFHVAGLQLVIVQASRSRGGQVAHLQAVDALGQVQSKQINGIKGSGHCFAQGA